MPLGAEVANDSLDKIKKGGVKAYDDLLKLSKTDKNAVEDIENQKSEFEGRIEVARNAINTRIENSEKLAEIEKTTLAFRETVKTCLGIAQMPVPDNFGTLGLSDLLNMYEEITTAEVERLASEDSEAVREVERLQATVKELQSDNDVAKTTIARLEATIEQLQSEKSRASEEVAQSNNMSGELPSENSDAAGELEKLKTKVKELESQIESQKQELIEARAQPALVNKKSDAVTQAELISTTSNESVHEEKQLSYKERLRQARAQVPALDLNEFCDTFKSKFENTNSSGIKKIIAKMDKLEQDSSMSNPDKQKAILSIMKEAGGSRKDRFLSRSLLTKGRTAGVQELYDIMSKKSFEKTPKDSFEAMSKTLADDDLKFVHEDSSPKHGMS